MNESNTAFSPGSPIFAIPFSPSLSVLAPRKAEDNSNAFERESCDVPSAALTGQRGLLMP